MLKQILIFLTLFGVAFAQWSTDPSENTRVTHGGLLPQLISDGSGGAFIVYQDSPALLRQLWVQRLDKNGYVRFPENGIRTSSADRYQTPYYYLVSDSLGGVIILFQERLLKGNEETGDLLFAVYAQRIDSTGKKLWTDAGLEISSFGEDKAPISACSDGQNGAYVFYGEDADSNGVFELRAQRIKSDGQIAWPDTGLIISDNFPYDNISNPNPAVSDGAGNAIILYSENDRTDPVIKLQKLNPDGEFLWDNGVRMFEVGRRMISDNLGGAIISGVRREFDGVSVKHIVRSQRVDRDGRVLWGEKGVSITDKADDQTFSAEMACDKWGNSYFVWRDRRSGKFDLYVQKLNALGIPLWKRNGLKIIAYDSPKSINDNGIASTPDGNIVLIWRDKRIKNWGLFAQRLDSSGNIQWKKNDIPISIRNDYQKNHKVISNLSGGAIVCWYEIGTGSGWGIFAQQVSRYGNLGEVVRTSIGQKPAKPTQFVLYQSYPNPFNSETIIKYELPKVTHVTLKIYDINGKEVMILINKKQQAGIHQVIWNGKNHRGGDVSSGIYIYQLSAGSFVDIKKCIYVK